MNIGEGIARLRQNTRDRFRLTGERAVARQVSRRAKLLEERGKALQNGLAFAIDPIDGTTRGVYSKPGGLDVSAIGVKDGISFTKLVNAREDRWHYDALTVFTPQRRGKKPKIEIASQEGYTNPHIEHWSNDNRRRRLELMREFGLIPTDRKLKPPTTRHAILASQGL